MKVFKAKSVNFTEFIFKSMQMVKFLICECFQFLLPLLFQSHELNFEF